MSVIRGAFSATPLGRRLARLSAVLDRLLSRPTPCRLRRAAAVCRLAYVLSGDSQWLGCLSALAAVGVPDA